ncbi:MAG TPA: DUF2752 domain-containing protein [Acidimicrobiia bacterium]|jgi:hypothetical protein|nr:DUF2752 domain-containing protein [Acidimicrobiia bacterium]
MSEVAVDRRATRIVAGAMLGAAVVWPRLPVHPPLACPFRTLTGIPCPLCGMTRAVVAATHGHLLESLRFNPAGILVVVLAIALLAGLRVDRVRIPPWTIALFGALLWAWNVGFNPTFH